MASFPPPPAPPPTRQIERQFGCGFLLLTGLALWLLLALMFLQVLR